jgi:hypothetical protein
VEKDIKLLEMMQDLSKGKGDGRISADGMQFIISLDSPGFPLPVN